MQRVAEANDRSDEVGSGNHERAGSPYEKRTGRNVMIDRKKKETYGFDERKSKPQRVTVSRKCPRGLVYSSANGANVRMPGGSTRASYRQEIRKFRTVSYEW